MSAYVPAIGATCLGIVIGWLVRYFIRRFDKFGPTVLGATISIVLGGAVIKFLDADRTVWWFYPIGLLIGMVLYQLIAMRYNPPGNGGRDDDSGSDGSGGGGGGGAGGGGGGGGGWAKNGPVFGPVKTGYE